ncbi:hypothetical protein DDI_1058 [Dickeya dianthicola RNS04.9]|nr:hypothetical protein DDI_1058 [Dickeya dianthicola RNS04.9]
MYYVAVIKRVTVKMVHLLCLVTHDADIPILKEPLKNGSGA